MNSVFIDTDVLIDFLTSREPFAKDVKRIFQYSFEKKIKLYTSSISITNSIYILGRISTSKTALSKIEKILAFISVLNVGSSEIKKAINSEFTDFEDAVQHFCALDSSMDLIITRNVKDYRKSQLAVLTPMEYISKIKSIVN